MSLYSTAATRTRRTENAALAYLDSKAGSLDSWGLHRLYKLAASGKGKSEEDGGFLSRTHVSTLS